jgi:hypothetical protein
MKPDQEVRLEQGLIRYRDIGSGPAIVFVHGLLVNGDLWRGLVPVLSRTHVPSGAIGSFIQILDDPIPPHSLKTITISNFCPLSVQAQDYCDEGVVTVCNHRLSSMSSPDFEPAWNERQD